MKRRGVTRALSVAPMMDVTDRHTRWLYRRISRETLLYTEMVTALAVHHGDAEKLLGFDASERPIALQLGGDDAGLLALAARRGAEFGYDEINLNVGCPSPRVTAGNFGACLMRTPDVVARAVRAIRDAVDLPVTVKCRIGVDDQDGYDDLVGFARAMVEAGADRLTVHARKAWLNGLSPHQNRTVPPLRYGDVVRLKREISVPVEINGGVLTLDEAARHLEQVDAVMIGRAVWNQPWILADADSLLFGSSRVVPTREEVAMDLLEYAETRVRAGDRAVHVLRNATPLFAGQVGARAWKRAMAEASQRGPRVILDGLRGVREARERHDQVLAGEVSPSA
jgi:tRNA-dihydrouridine synthase A